MNSLPKEFEYVGYGGVLSDKIRNMAADHAEDILMYTYSSMWKQRYYLKAPLCFGAEYAFRIGSPIYRAWKQETQPMKYEVGKTYRVVNSNFLFIPARGIGAVGDTFTVNHVDSNGSACDKYNNTLAYIAELKKGYVVLVEDEPNQQWPYKINPDGSVTRNGYTITAEEVEILANLTANWSTKAVFQSQGGNLTVSCPLSHIKIGCQTIKRDELEAFIKEYQSGEWKEQDVMVQLGDLVQDETGEVYIVADLGSTVGLVNRRNGRLWSNKNLPLLFNGGSKYSLKAMSGKTGNFKLIKE